MTPYFVNRKVLKLKLSNDLEAYLISDPQAFKSAAALVVQIGSWEDLPEYPGLAHFLEHMLFLGTHKYPLESDYDQFIRMNNGQSNAYTTGDHTLYAFSASNEAFEKALDRFASFFKTPLFNPSGVDRELQAIDQEFAKNVNQDKIREFYVIKELSNPKHPFHRFASGNSNTLSLVSQKTLKHWYQEYYSAGLMHLIVYSSLPVETLKKIVIREFKGIQNTNRSSLKISTPLIADSQKGKLVFINPIKNIRTLRILWELPSRFAHMLDTKPASLACYVLGYEGPGSLLSLLKQDNLAEEINCTSDDYLGPDHLLMSLHIHLTEEGLKSLNSVIAMCFEAIANLKDQGFPFYIFEELQTISLLRYQYQSRKDPFDYVMEIGEWMLHESLETFPEHSLVLQKFDADAALDLLNYLTPQDAMIIVMTDPKNSGVNPEKQEHWMGVSYAVRLIPPEILADWKKPKRISNLYLPNPNPFIPKQFSVSMPSSSVQDLKQIPDSEILVDNDEAKIYYAKDKEFLVPQTLWYFLIKTPSIEEDQPGTVALAELYVKSLEDSLKPYSYHAKAADLEYEIERSENGFALTLTGYNDNAEILFDKILGQLKDYSPSRQLFEIIKESLLREYQNFAEESPLKQAQEIYQSLIYKDFSTHRQKAQALQKISYEQFLTYISHLFDATYTKGMVYGNVDKEQALRLWEKLRHQLASRPYPIKDQPVRKIIRLPEKHGPYFIAAEGKSSGNVLLLGLEDSTFSFKTRAAQQILSQAMSNPFYAALRTKQQTGYIVQNSAEELEKHLFSFFAVQSNTHDPRDLLARFELFIESFLQEMSKTELTKERFELYKQELINNLKQHPHQSLTDMGDLLKTLVFKYEGDFEWINKRIQGFKDLTYEDFSEIASQFLGKSNKRRLAVLIQGAVAQEGGFKYIQLNDIEELRKTRRYSSAKNE